MPFENERSNKASHVDITKNPDVKGFLDACDLIKPPSDTEAQAFASRFVAAPVADHAAMPDLVVAFDGSLYTSQVYPNALPSTRVGYVKVSSFAIKTEEFNGIRDQTTGMVDPLAVARLRDGASAYTLTLPGSNVRYGGRSTVREGFRAALEAHFLSERTWLSKDPSTSLRSTLFAVAARRSRNSALYTGDPSVLRLHKCPTCETAGTPQTPIEVRDLPGPQKCRHCGSELFATDCLRIWEAVSESNPIGEALGRTMSLLEHLLPMHYARFLANYSLRALAGMCFFMDGPLAVFGNAAWIHAGILRLYHELNDRLKAQGLPSMLMLGLQKTGAVREHVDLIDRFVGPGRILPLGDQYRYEYVTPRETPGAEPEDDIGFGLETYYGQDFIYKTTGSNTFVFGTPYPFARKADARAKVGKPFREAKVDLALYPDLPRVLKVLDHFQSDLYRNASIPLALAHQHTAISLEPGGRVLDVLTHRELTNR